MKWILYWIINFIASSKYLRFIYNFYYDLKKTKNIIDFKLTNLWKNLEWIEEYNINVKSFDIENKKYWISGIARLYNSWEFLEEVIESVIDLYDEIILVNNNSSDDTKEICLKLLEKYPEKIIYKEYPFKLATVMTKEHMELAGNSIYSLSYYYNWCFSQASYQFVSKIDDDNLFFISKEEKQKIRNIVLNSKNNEQKYFVFSWKNIIFKDSCFKELKLSAKNKFCGLFNDIWFYMQNQKTYYIKDKKWEKFTGWKSLYWLGVIFYHLKYCKKQYLPRNGVFTHPEHKWYIIYEKKNSKINTFLQNILKWKLF